MKVSYVTCTDCECREVDKGKEDRLKNEGNVTDVKERESNAERQTRLVNLCRHLHISIMVLHINWLAEEQIIELDVQSSEKGQ